MKPVLGVAEVGRIRVTDQRSRVSRRTRGEEALGPIESAYREQNGVPARSPDSLPVRCSPRLHFLSLSLFLSLSPLFSPLSPSVIQSRGILLWTLRYFSFLSVSFSSLWLLLILRCVSSFLFFHQRVQRLFSQRAFASLSFETF